MGPTSGVWPPASLVNWWVPSSDFSYCWDHLQNRWSVNRRQGQCSSGRRLPTHLASSDERENHPMRLLIHPSDSGGKTFSCNFGHRSTHSQPWLIDQAQLSDLLSHRDSNCLGSKSFALTHLPRSSSSGWWSSPADCCTCVGRPAWAEEQASLCVRMGTLASTRFEFRRCLQWLAMSFTHRIRGTKRSRFKWPKRAWQSKIAILLNLAESKQLLDFADSQRRQMALWRRAPPNTTARNVWTASPTGLGVKKAFDVPYWAYIASHSRDLKIFSSRHWSRSRNGTGLIWQGCSGLPGQSNQVSRETERVLYQLRDWALVSCPCDCLPRHLSLKENNAFNLGLRQ